MHRHLEDARTWRSYGQLPRRANKVEEPYKRTSFVPRWLSCSWWSSENDTSHEETVLNEALGWVSLVASPEIVNSLACLHKSNRFWSDNWVIAGKVSDRQGLDSASHGVIHWHSDSPSCSDTDEGSNDGSSASQVPPLNFKQRFQENVTRPSSSQSYEPSPILPSAWA